MNLFLKKLQAFVVTVLPVFVITSIAWVFVVLPIREAFIYQQKEVVDLQVELASWERRQAKLARQSTVALDVPALEWKNDNPNGISLAIQSAIDRLAQKNQLQLQLIGPFGSRKEGLLQRHAIEIETDTTFQQALYFLNDIEKHSPPLGISNLSIRPLSQRGRKKVGTPVYFRAVIWGYSSP